jgi:hypothetical protein
MSNDASFRITVGRVGARRYRRTDASACDVESGMACASRASVARSESSDCASRLTV